MGRAGEVSLSAGGGDCCKDLAEHEGWEAKHQKITQGVNCRCQKGKPGPQHLCVTVVGQVKGQSGTCHLPGAEPVHAPFSSGEQRRGWGGRGPPPSMATATSASPSTTRE